MQQRLVGKTTVGAIGLGAMPLSVRNHPDEADAVRVVHAALDVGVTLLDTADAYSVGAEDFGAGERLLCAALRSYSGDTSDVLIATKGGHTRTPDGGWGLDGRPAYLRAACERSLAALEVEAIGLYQYHRPDPKVPYADSIGALRDLLDEGKVRHVGISNASPTQIELAESILGHGRLAAVQNEFSPAYRSSLPELRLCGQRGIAFLPWSPLGGIGKASGLGSEQTAFAAVADSRGLSPQQVALAWMLALGPDVIPIPGSSRPATIRASAEAAEIELSPEEMAVLS
jgi:aryl-alcohol dehydrogenase-like predicted oxidoreductase